jgi:hypothetical protein
MNLLNLRRNRNGANKNKNDRSLFLTKLDDNITYVRTHQVGSF